MHKLIFCILIAPLSLFAQNIEDFRFYNISDGLSHKRVQVITQDNDGFIWLGTYGGLNRFNGIEFDIYESNDDPNSLPSDDVRGLLVDSKGTLWITTNNGIARYIKNRDHFETFDSYNNPGLPDNGAYSIVESQDGKIWFGTNKGLCFFENGQFTTMKSVPSALVKTVSIDQEGRIWASSLDETYVISQNDVIIGVLSDLLGNTVYEIMTSVVDQQNNVWLGSRSQGLIKVSDYGRTNQSISYFRKSESTPGSISSDRILHVNVVESGDLWVSTEEGLSKLAPFSNSFEVLTSDPKDEKSLFGKSVWYSFQDASKRLWVSIYNQGIDVYDPKYDKFETVSQEAESSAGLSNNNVTTFMIDNSEEVWIGTDGGGVNVWNKTTNLFEQKRFDRDDNRSLGSDAVLDIYKDSDNTIWIATWAGGLNKYNRSNGTFTRFNTERDNSITNNNVFEVAEDYQGNLWVGSFNGVDIITKQGDRLLNIAPSETASRSLVDDQVISLLVLENIAWIGTQGGLSRVEFNSSYDYSVQNFRHDVLDSTSISSNIINDIYQDQNGTFWFATKEGLSWWNEAQGNFVTLTRKDGLPAKEIVSVFELDRGKFWITTTKGIADLRIEDKQITQRILFDKSDGLQSNNFLRGSYEISQDGVIYMGGSNGFNYFDLEKIKPNQELAHVFFTGIKINNQPINIGNSEKIAFDDLNNFNITLDRFDNILTVEFIGLNYTHPEKNYYAYKLEGFEENWNYVEGQRFATYTNLDPDNYTLLVKASNNDQVWNEVPATLDIKILPPWWGTWWFRGFSTLAVLLVILSIANWRARSARRSREELKRKVREATEQVETQNRILRLEQEKLNNAIEETNYAVKLAVESGDFTTRIKLDDKEGEWKKLGESINSLFDSIVTPFTTITEIIGAMATSNLSMRYEKEAKGDVLKLSSSLNYSLDNLSGLLGTLVENMAEIGTATQEMLESGQEMRVGTGEIASSTSELSRGAQEQVSRIDEASHILENILQSSTKVSDQAQSINQAAEKGAQISDQGKNQMHTMDTSMQSMLTTSKESSNAIENLSGKSSNISSILNSIKEITIETNMLALNAAIEAAKAGDAGRGFAVVADQIRKLAENSNHFALEIEQIISEVQTSIGETSSLISDMGLNIDGGVKASRNASKSFDELAASYAQTLGLSNQILNHSEEQHSKIKEVVQLMESVVVISEQAAAGTEEIASSSHELSSGMNEYIESSSQVSEIIQRLNEKMQQFKLR